MKSIMGIAKRFVRDEKAAEVTELGIVLALIVAGSVAIIAAIGPRIIQAYQATDDALSGAPAP